MHSPFVAFLIEASSWSSASSRTRFSFLLGGSNCQGLISPTGSKALSLFSSSIEVSKSENRTPSSNCLNSQYYLPCPLCILCTRVTYQVTWSNSKRLRPMIYWAALRTVFRAKKWSKKHSKFLISVSLCYLRYLDGIPKKCLFSRQLPFKQHSSCPCI